MNTAAESIKPMYIGARSLTFVPHYVPNIGPRVFLIIDEMDLHEAFNLTIADARLLADRLKIAACEAEAISKRRERPRSAL